MVYKPNAIPSGLSSPLRWRFRGYIWGIYMRYIWYIYIYIYIHDLAIFQTHPLGLRYFSAWNRIMELTSSSVPRSRADESAYKGQRQLRAGDWAGLLSIVITTITNSDNIIHSDNNHYPLLLLSLSSIMILIIPNSNDTIMILMILIVILIVILIIPNNNQ